MTKRHIKLSEQPGQSIRFLTGVDIKLADGKTSSVVTVTRTGSFTDPRYGRFEISQDMLLAMVKNFNANTYGQDIFLDIDHKPGNGAAGKITKLSVEGNRLRAQVEWTPYGIESVKNKGYQYLSAEYHENYTDNETGQQHGPVLLGAALTVRPVIKKLDPVRLSEGLPGPVLLHPDLLFKLSQEFHTMHKEYLKRLTAYLTGLLLAQPVVAQLASTFEEAAKELGEDKARLDALYTQFESTGKTLSEQIGDKSVTLSITAPESGRRLSEEDVKRLLADDRAARDQEAKTLAEKHTANVTLFNKLLSESEGLKNLDEDSKKALAAAADLITSDMTEAQVTKLAEHQIKLGNDLLVNRQLSSLGYNPRGSVQITQTDQRTAQGLQETILNGLKTSSAFGLGKLKLSEKEHPFVTRVLAEFDALNAPRIAEESKQLAGGSTAIADTNLPIGFQRTVIREALSDFRILELVNTLTDFGATATTQIPYEYRDVSAVFNDGIVYENQPIHRASIVQASDTAYILPTKIAFIISNEVIHFSRSSAIDWDAYARNVESNARFIQELLVRRIANELLRSSDAYLAANITGEAFDAQLTGSNSILKTVQFPIVRPKQVKDLQGNNIGSVQNPIALVLNGVTINEYDGTGTQGAGTYYRVTSYNLGYIQLVNQLGVAVTPTDTGTNTLGYSYSTNVVKFSTDNGSTAVDIHLNGLLRAVGARKAILADDRYAVPDFLLMSNTLNDIATNAEQFSSSGSKLGTEQQGDLERIKNVPAWSTNAPSIDLGDERILLGQRGTLTYTIAKPFTTGQPFEAVNSAGKPTGQKQAYGEEYSAIHVPTTLRNRLTSVLVYSAAGR